MKCLFSCSTQYLTHSLHSVVIYQVEPSKRNFISPSTHVLFCMSENANMTAVTWYEDILQWLWSLFLEPSTSRAPDNSNQKSLPLDLPHSIKYFNLTPNFLDFDFVNPFSFPLEVEKPGSLRSLIPGWKITVSSKGVQQQIDPTSVVIIIIIIIIKLRHSLPSFYQECCKKL